MNTFFEQGVVFYADSLKDKFLLPGRQYSFFKFVVTPELINKRSDYSHFYRKTNGETIEFYEVHYSFENNKLQVIHTLLYKLPNIEKQ